MTMMIRFVYFQASECYTIKQCEKKSNIHNGRSNWKHKLEAEKFFRSYSPLCVIVLLVKYALLYLYNKQASCDF